MKMIMVIAFLAITSLNAEALSKNGLDGFLQKTDASLLYSAQTVRIANENYKEMMQNAPADMPKVSCSVVKDVMSQISTQLRAITVEFNERSSLMQKDFQVRIKNRLHKLAQETTEALEKCSDPELITAKLSSLREELMSASMDVQSYKFTEDI